MSSQADRALSQPGTDVSDASWRSLARAGAVAAFIATALFLTDVVVLTTGGAMPRGDSHLSGAHLAHTFE